jgi:hypothetical protein
MSVFMSRVPPGWLGWACLAIFYVFQFDPLEKAIVNFGRGAIPIGLKLPDTVVNQDVGSVPNAPA